MRALVLKSIVETLAGKWWFLLPALAAVFIRRYMKRGAEPRIKNAETAFLKNAETAFFVYLTFLAAATVMPVIVIRGGEVEVFGMLRGMDGPHGFYAKLNLIPLRQLVEAAPLGAVYFITNIVGNIAVFVPVGFAPPLIWGFSYRKTVLFGAAASVLIELLQLPQTRWTDVDDVLLNTAGTALGCLACFAAKAVINNIKRRNTEKAIRDGQYKNNASGHGGGKDSDDGGRRPL